MIHAHAEAARSTNTAAEDSFDIFLKKCGKLLYRQNKRG